MFSRFIIGLLIAVSCTVTYAFNFHNNPPKILPLGDSITEGNGGLSYRYHLKKLAQQDEFVDFDFIGTEKGPTRATFDSHDNFPADFLDNEHEGWSGRKATDVIWYEKHPGTQQSRLEYALAQETPDIVLIHLGTNDLLQTDANHLDNAITEAINAIKDGISMIRSNNPDVVILLAKIIPLYNKPSAYQRVPSFNEAIQRLANEINTDESPVVLVDQFSDITHEDLYDGVHQKASGEKKMAQKWFNALKPFFNDKIKPEISLYGDNPVNLAIGQDYYDEGAYAEDNRDGEINVSIDASHVNTHKKGTYTVYFTATDSAGNQAKATRTVTIYVPDTTPPVITLNGDKTVWIKTGLDYTDAGARAFDDIDGERDVSINDSEVDTSGEGTYQVWFTASDTSGNTSEVVRTVNVYTPDTKAPVITLNGSKSISIRLGTKYHDAGATAIDDNDGERPVGIDVSAINTSKAGTYQVIFTASDKAGNTTKATRTVVVFTPDTNPPVIKLKGKNLITIKVGTPYRDPGAIAVDDTDGRKPVNINTSGVNINKPGTYSVVFTAVDKAGNRAKAARIVKVYKPKPNSSNQGSNTNTDNTNNESGSGGGNFSLYLLAFFGLLYGLKKRDRKRYLSK